MRRNLMPVSVVVLLMALTLVTLPLGRADTNIQKWLPKITTTELDNHLTLMTSRTASNDMTVVGILIRVGSASDPEGKAGLANITAKALLMGTNELSAAAFSEKLATLCSNWSLEVGHDATLFLFELPASDLSPLLDLMAGAMANPLMNEDVLRLTRTRSAAELQWQATQVRNVLNRNLYEFVFTKHPYGTPIHGSRASLDNIRLGDLKEFYNNYYGANNAAIAIIGDVVPMEVAEIVKHHFGEWRTVNRSAVSISEPARASGMRVRLVNRLGSDLSNICLARPAPGIANTDYLTVMALSEILAGGDYARLNRSLTTEKQACYEVGSKIEPAAVSTFRIGAICRGTETGKTIKGVMRTLQQIATDGVTTREAEIARNRLIHRMMADVTNNTSLARTLLIWNTNGIKATSLNDLVARVNQITADKMSKVAAQILNPDRFALLVIGDRNVVAHDLQRLADVEVVNFAGEIPVPAMRTVLPKISK